MNENWERVQSLFLEALELLPEKRDAFLDQACAGEDQVRREVESLLASDDTGIQAIEEALESTMQSLLDSEDLAGTRLGVWRILEQIGRGGMGTVYLATRDDDQFRKRVAIKVVKRGMDTAELLIRFGLERQILAHLEHPYIARLIDAGSTPHGQPYLVMEYVEGRPIHVYCREAGLSVEARLHLFLKVCEAVSYAHRNLVVHRDLKPGNLLVAADGSPKLLDFGLAKLLDPELGSGLTLTLVGGRLLTPEYASPEQVRGEFVGTASDIYSLGAILYELLTGVRAQRVESNSPAELEKAICDTDVPPPSTRIASQNMRLRKLLAGDLDNIVLMAMRKEPAQRYSSVDLLAEDIRWHLEARPVKARRPSLSYRLGKYVRRHRIWLAAGALVVLSLVGGTWAALSSARHAHREQQLAEVQRQVAERERTRAESQKQIAEREQAQAEVQKEAAEQARAHADEETQLAVDERNVSQRRLQEMLQLANSSLFDLHTAIEKLPGATEARRQIVVTTLKFLENLSKEAGQDDRLKYELSVSYSKVARVQGFPRTPNLGDTNGAIANYKKSIDWIKALLQKEPNNPQYILQWIDAQTGWAAVIASTGADQAALTALREVLPPAQRLPQLCPEETRCWLAEGPVSLEMVTVLAHSDLEAALRCAHLHSEFLKPAMQPFPNNAEIQVALANAYSVEARVRNKHGDLRESADLYQRAVALRERALRSNPSDVLMRRELMLTYANLGGNLGSPIYLNLGDSAGAREYYGKALVIARELAEVDSNNQLAQFDLATMLLFYSVLDLPREQWQESLANLQQAHAILQKQIAADPQSLAKLSPLALAEEYEGHRLEALGRGEEAVARYRESLATAEKQLAGNPSDFGFITQALNSEEALAETLARQGNRADALTASQNAIARAERLSAAKTEPARVSRLIATAYQSSATVNATLGNWNEARAAAERAVKEWHQLIASGSRLADPAKVAKAEALLQECNSHVQQVDSVAAQPK
jgi:serine/threonine protein kinase